MQTEIAPKSEMKCAQSEFSFSCNSNPSIRKLLDVVSYILANEYVRAVKENPTLFGEIASAASRPRNDRGDLI